MDSISPGGQPCMVERVTEEERRGETASGTARSSGASGSHGVPANRPGRAASSAVSRR